MPEWQTFEPVFVAVGDEFASADWFAAGWRHRAGNYGTGALLRLWKQGWCDGAVHLESWLSNADVKRGTIPVALHAETSKQRHGLDKGEFRRLVAEYGAGAIADWPSAEVPDRDPTTIVRSGAPFTAESLAAVLREQFTHARELESAIDRAIAEATK